MHSPDLPIGHIPLIQSAVNGNKYGNGNSNDNGNDNDNGKDNGNDSGNCNYNCSDANHCCNLIKKEDWIEEKLSGPQ